MDILTAIVLIAILLVLVAPIVEIALKRPETFLELTGGARAFAEAPLPKSTSMEAAADDRKVEDLHPDHERLAA